MAPSTRSTGRSARRSGGFINPTVRELKLTDYKVRVLSGGETGTSSVVRVQVETTDGTDTWGTVGASSDIIDASYTALIDAIEYKLIKDKVAPQASEAVTTAV